MSKAQMSRSQGREHELGMESGEWRSTSP